MIELVVVILLMGVMATIAIPRMTSPTALRERGVQDQLRAMLRHSRKLAVSQQRDVCVLLQPAQLRVVYTNAVGCNAAAPVAEPGSTAPFVAPVPAGVVLGGVAAVRFNRNGQPVPNADQVVNVGAQAFTVSRETGLVF